MKIERQIDQILQENLPAIAMGEATLESVLEKYPRIEAELLTALEASIWLQQTRFSLVARPGYIHDSRKYLEAKITSLAPHNSWQRILDRYSLKRWIFNVTAPVIIFLMLALVINSAVLTARLSIPGDALYSTKLLIEDAQLTLTFNQVRQADLTIEFSRRRALEFVELVMVGEYDNLPTAAERMEAEIITSLHALEEIPTDELGNVSAMSANFRESLESEMQMLEVLKSTSPFTAQKGIEMAINVAQGGIWALR